MLARHIPPPRSKSHQICSITRDRVRALSRTTHPGWVHLLRLLGHKLAPTKCRHVKCESEASKPSMVWSSLSTCEVQKWRRVQGHASFSTADLDTATIAARLWITPPNQHERLKASNHDDDMLLFQHLAWTPPKIRDETGTPFNDAVPWHTKDSMM
jgi:hypothetical protein